MKRTYTHDTSIMLFDSPHAHIGEIDARITYRVTSWGSPAVRYLSNGDPGDPAEPAEIEVDSVEMALEPREAVGAEDLPYVYTEWVDAWDWLADHVGELAEGELADELVTEALESDQDTCDSYAEDRADEARLDKRP